ncbi:uncharacterized protein KIAA0232 homolog isoform X2 [Latimeria chalumnae]|uniref:uncharacterized protein KIAA0232 homolog isoform X2 n=1 Tax=Latimeria chalumnae TaxID=7897 RepID=UPI0006D8EC12|nr:PREDICTED: uncharacterized protein KIAA0232 homolog isoform X2 [Latimeria chalumnae]|eukprot:XP_014344479.1 PREDICTED: uncharacterized protein KIAA0232 homolog isoform X2 [Latimeria chalumnae]
MRPVCTVVDGLPSEASPDSYPIPISASEMSLLHALGPVQTWLGQELEKCGIDAMIYTRYVLSLLLHDSYDYDLQEQENDIFLGWEKGTSKKWGKGRKKCSDLSLEEMKKQAAVQCLRSASDESSGIETLVEELCSRLKDLQNKQKEEKISRKAEGSQSPEVGSSPTAKDQVEMYYEAFPPLSEKPVCLQEIMTVWNKAKVCSYSSSSSSSAAPQTSTDTSSPKDCNSESEATKERAHEASATINERTQLKRSKKEKENRFSNNLAEEKLPISKKQVRHKSEGKMRPRSWSSGSSEAGSSSSGNQYELKPPIKFVKVRHKIRENRNKKGRNGQVRLSMKTFEKEEKKNGGSSSSSSGPIKHQFCKRGKRPLREARRKDASSYESKDFCFESKSEKEYKEEPLWYTEPITEYFVPLSRKSKLETTYRNQLGTDDITSASAAVGKLSDSMHGLSLSNNNIQKTYLAAGTFIDGHFVEMPAVIDEADNLSGTSCCSQAEDNKNLDDIHPSELTHFYEVDIYKSILDPSASDLLQGESRILSMIRQKSKEKNDFEAECCIVLDGLDLKGESAIWTDSYSSVGAEGLFMQDLGNIAQFWECCSSSSADEADGESFPGDSPIRLSPILDDTVFSKTGFAGNQELFSDANEGSGINSSYFSTFEVQYNNSPLQFSFDTLNLGNENTDSSSSTNNLSKTQSRLLIWTKNSAFDENEHCSNLSTRTCSPWSHSEETRSDNETFNIQLEESTPFSTEEIKCIAPSFSSCYLEEELLDFLHEETCQQKNGALREIPSLVFKKKSKLESVCGIQLEQKGESKEYEATEVFVGEIGQQGEDCSSGVIKDIWTSLAARDSVGTLEADRTEDQLFSTEVNNYHCCCLDIEAKVDPCQEQQNKAVQRSEYHLWESQKENLEERPFITSEQLKLDGGDYTTPSKPWHGNPDQESAFILGGVYGELKTFNSDGDWAVMPPSHSRSSLLQCAASDVVTIAGTDVFMTPGNNFAPGHRPIWKPFMSFEHGEQAKQGEDRLNKGFSFIFHEDLLGSCGNFEGEEPGLEYSFSSFDLTNPFSQVLHVECSFEPEGIASFSPSFKPKSILCSDSENEVFHPRIYGVDRTQYRAIRISPRTHFRPISAAELSPGCGSESEFESEKEDLGIPVLSQADVFEDPQADLKPLEEDAEREGHYYGKSELESGKFLPRLKKAGMEKSAQTSLDSQEGSGGLLPTEDLERCPDCSVQASIKDTENHKIDCKMIETNEVKELCSCKVACHFPGNNVENCIAAPRLQEFPSFNVFLHGKNGSQQEECWWQKALFSSSFCGSQCAVKASLRSLIGSMLLAPERVDLKEILQNIAECYANTRGKVSVDCYSDKKENSHDEEHLLKLNVTADVCDASYVAERNSGARANGFRRKLFSGDGSSSDETASEGGSNWADPCEEDLFSRTHL